MRRILSVLLLVALLAACGPAPEQPGPTPAPGVENPTTAPSTDATPAPGGDEKVTISFAAWDYERQIYEPLVKKFNDANPNINVVIVPLDDMMNVSDPNADYSPMAQLRRVVSGADTGPAFVVAPEAYGSGLLLDLKPLMDADASFKADDFLPGALDQYTAKGGTWLLPRYLQVQILSYNKDLFKGAGLPEPKAGWSWNDLLGAAEQLAKKNGKQVDTYGFLDLSGGFLPLVALLQARDVDLLSMPAQKARLDSPEIVDAIKRVQSLIDGGAIFRPQYKEGPPNQNVDPAQLVRDGKIALWSQEILSPCAGPGCPPQQQTDLSFPVGKVPYPSTSASFMFGGNDGFIISGGTQHPNEAWKWIEFLSRQQTDQPNGLMGRGGGGFNPPGRVPARISLADATGFWKNLDDETAAAYKWAIAHPAPAPDRTPDYTIFGSLSGALEQILGPEKKDPQKALQEAQKQLEDQLANVQLTPTPKPDTSPVTVATPEPQTAPEGATTIKFSSNAYNPPDLRRIARAFRDQRPDIYVDIKATEVFTQPPTFKQLAASNDCFAGWTTPQSDDDYAALLDLQPLFDADASFPQSDYAAALLGVYQHNGGLYGLPYAATLRTLNYNKTAFDAAGVKPPSYQWTPDDFLAAAQSLTKGEGDKKQYGYIPLGGPQQDMMFFISQFGGRLTTGSGASARPSFTDPKTIAAIKWYLDLSSTHKVMPQPKFYYKRDDQGYEDKSYEMVQNGRAGMWFDQGYGMFGGPGGFPVKGGGPDTPQRNFEIGIAPLPIGKSGLSSSDLSLRGFHISAKSQHTQECWEWIKFLSGDVTNLQGSIPARASVLKSDTFKKQAPPELIELATTYEEALKRSRSSGQAVDMNAFYSMDTYWFFKALSETIEGKTPLDKGLDEAQKFTTAFMECMERTPGKPATCAQQTDPNYQGFNTEDPQPGPVPIDAVPRG